MVQVEKPEPRDSYDGQRCPGDVVLQPPPGFFEMINQPRQRQAQSSLFGSTDVIGRQLWNVGRRLLRLDVRHPDYLALSASTGVRRGGLVGHPHVP